MNAAPLPPVYLLLPDGLADARLLLRLETLLRSGVRLVQYRRLGEGSAAWRGLLAQVADLCHAYHARLLINASAASWNQHGVEAHGAHLGSQRLRDCRQRPLPSSCLLSVACHSLEDLRHAEQIRADLAVLSPIACTGSHPQDKPLGWKRFRDWISGSALPVYALGGMRCSDLPRSRRNGAQGIALIQGLWSGVPQA